MCSSSRTGEPCTSLEVIGSQLRPIALQLLRISLQVPTGLSLQVIPVQNPPSTKKEIPPMTIFHHAIHLRRSGFSSGKYARIKNKSHCTAFKEPSQAGDGKTEGLPAAFRPLCNIPTEAAPPHGSVAPRVCSENHSGRALPPHSPPPLLFPPRLLSLVT